MAIAATIRIQETQLAARAAVRIALEKIIEKTGRRIWEVGEITEQAIEIIEWIDWEPLEGGDKESDQDGEDKFAATNKGEHSLAGGNPEEESMNISKR